MPDPFIDAADLSDLLGRDVTVDNGAVIAIDAACDICRDIAETDFNAGTATVVLDGTGTDALVLPQYPVTAAGTVLVNGGTVTDYVLGGNGALFRGTAGGYCYGDGFGGLGYSGGYPYGGPVWPLGRQNVKVTYEFGYAPNVLPRSVRMVALQLASRLIVQGVAQSETVGDVQVDYGQAADELTENELRILRRYRRPRSF